MCRQESRLRLTPEEEIAAEESLSAYCKPVELYNILQRRAVRNPSFLQKCLRYKIQAKHKKRIQMTVALPATVNKGLQIEDPFPLSIMIARPASNLIAEQQQSACFSFKRFCVLTCAGDEVLNHAQAKFFLPNMNLLSKKIKCSSLAVLFISHANAGGNCLVGKIPMELLHLSWDKSPNLGEGERTEMLLTVDMYPCIMKGSLDGASCVSFQILHAPSSWASSQQLQVMITAEEVGANERTPYDSYSFSDIPSTSLSHIARLRTGNVVFNYRYYNNKLQRTEVTEDFSCPFCLVKCVSFKGLKYHLFSSHDLFNFEFWITEEYQAVNVSVKTDVWRSEVIADGVDPKQQTFFFCYKPLRRRKPKNLVQHAKHVHPLVLDSDLPASINDLPDRTGDHGCVQSLAGGSLAPPTMLEFAKTRKLSVERSDPKNRALLQKRQFFHSHRAQPMALEQVLSDRDSEDEVDDDVADLEDRRMLDDFVDVTKDEKQMMHLWNSFVRKQRVLADGHIPWACEAFSKLHALDLVEAPALLWCWRLFMIKLWNHGLLDARTINNCNVSLEQCQNRDIDPMKSLQSNA